MKHYIGIDLGTTNSAICSYDGENLRLYKSPEQNDVTPSAIFIDRRGKKYLGKTAYDNAAKNPGNAAIKFKRMMGTSTPIKLPAVNVTMTPEECSAEILKVCFGYLPEEVRNDPATGTVITVPAAFNQMQKDATMAAAEMAGIGKVALMQEPVAAVMSVMKQRKGDGVFLVFDLGGGTLDIAIAESTSGRVSLLAHGGASMCGGADFDRAILDNVVKPWLKKKFNLPEDLTVNPKYQTLLRLSVHAAERAKIELASKEEAVITTVEDIDITDESGAEIYLDIPISRSVLNESIASKINEAVNAARETLEEAGLGPNDVERIVFVGGPTQYKPLRDKVATELCIAASTEVNPMTAVAEGAAVFAESIDWGSDSRGRKSQRGTISTSGKLDLNFNFIARTPDSSAKIVVKLAGAALAGTEFQIDSLDTGWQSGRSALKDGATVEVPLTKPGDNVFKVWVFDAAGGAVNIGDGKIVIARTIGAVDAIPASSSIGIEVTEKGRPELAYLIKKQDRLPTKGTVIFKAVESLRAQSSNSFNFIVREGEITDQIRENRVIGEFSIKGSDFDEGVIPQGGKLVCDYEILDSGQLRLSVTVPDISGQFESRNFYSRQEGQIDFSDASRQIADEVDTVRNGVDKVASKVSDPKLEQARQKLEQAASVQAGETDPEKAKQAMENVQGAKKLLADVRKSNMKPIRQMDLDSCVDFFNRVVRQHSRPTEATAFDNLARTAQRAIDSNNGDFQNHLEELRGRNWQILWRQDFFVVDVFKRLSEEPWQFANRKQHAELVIAGKEAVKADDIEKLRGVVGQLYSIRISSGGDDDMLAPANITRG